ncbi:MAG: hypothetical protein ACTIJN_00565 [Microbacterium gubbeenense]|uniref:hypothetical protein n=1 Tax=Microbacterium gubbeenense TaxID=159896 RepID=UPI0004287AE9|nr:hypothetical protein [Microbacterium gubbeenense]
MNVMDSLVWLANFPATHAYEMVFLGAFSALGLVVAARQSVPKRSRLDQLRVERGMAGPEFPAASRVAAKVQSWFFFLLALVVFSGFVIAIASLIFGPITRGYIYEHGERAVAIQTDDMGSFETVTFDADNGHRYTLNLPFFSPVTYPDRDAFVSGSEDLVVRYLPNHPQAFVIDTRQSLDSWGEPLGG